MPLVHQQRVMRLRMRVPPRRQQHDRAQVHRASPEFRQQRALHAQVLHPLRILRRRNRRNDFCQADAHHAARGGIDVQALRLAIKIAGLAFPVLPFALVHRHFHGVPVRAMKRGVAAQKSLHVVIARGNLAQARGGIAQRGRVDHGRLPRRQPVHIHAKILLRIHARIPAPEIAAPRHCSSRSAKTRAHPAP